MAPEQFRNEPIDRTVDVRAAAIVLWETLTGQRMMSGGSDAAIVERVLYGAPVPATEIVPALPAEIDAVIARALAAAPKDRFATAKELAIAIERAIPRASVHEVAEWLPTVAGETLEKRAAMVSAIETASPSPPPSSSELAPEQAASAQTIVDEKPTRSRRPISVGVLVLLAALGGTAFFLARRSEAPKAEEPPAAAAPSSSTTIAIATASTSAPPVAVSETAKPDKPPDAAPSSPKPKSAAAAPKKPVAKPAPTAQTTAKAKSMLPAGLPDDRD
jgi:serine/threonine-protein kinase